jgi:hypothetical protein
MLKSVPQKNIVSSHYKGSTSQDMHFKLYILEDNMTHEREGYIVHIVPDLQGRSRAWRG